MYQSIQHRPLPAAITDKTGKPLLSWRVALLPYMENVVYYQQFHLDEPWDSEHNLQFAKTMPFQFRSPFYSSNGIGTVPQATTYLGLFSKEAKGGHETKSLIAIVEANPERAVAWTAPDGDLTYDQSAPLAGLGSAYHGFPLASKSGFFAAATRSRDNNPVPEIKFFPSTDTKAFAEFVDRAKAQSPVDSGTKD